MDPLTHFMTGACLSRAGLNRRAAYTTLAMTLAAEAPDLDVLWSFKGPVAGFAHHRGITHTFLGIPFEAAIIIAAVWCLHRWRAHHYRTKPPIPHNPITDQPNEAPLTAAPIHWPLLYLFSLLALLSHLLLDYTNNYGLRPFYPFNPRWYSGSIVFIVEPVLFAALLAALVLPDLFRLINSEVGARRTPFRGRTWAIAALLATLALWLWRYTEQQKALALAATLDLSATQPPGSPAVPILRLTASPWPITPYRWHIVVDTPGFYQIATADTLRGTLSITTPSDIFPKPQTTLATLAAKRTPLGEAYLDWSSHPLVTDTTSLTQDPTAAFTVTFRDLRFFYDVPFMDGRAHPPLTGQVILDANRNLVNAELNGRTERR